MQYISDEQSGINHIALANKVVAFARKSAATKIRSARARALRRIKRIHATARAKGMEAAQAASRVEVANALLSVERERLSIVRSASEEILEAALLLAQEIVATELQTSSDSLNSRLRELLQAIESRDAIRLTVARSDLQSTKSLLTTLGLSNLELQATDEMAQGTAYLETCCGAVELDPWRQLAALADNLRESLKQNYLGAQV